MAAPTPGSRRSVVVVDAISPCTTSATASASASSSARASVTPRSTLAVWAYGANVVQHRRLLELTIRRTP